MPTVGTGLVNGLWYADLVSPDNAGKLVDNAHRLVDHVAIPQAVLDYLYSRSRSRSGSRAEWERQVKLALAMDAILRDFLRPVPLDDYGDLIDRNACVEAGEYIGRLNGGMVLAFHGGFVVLVRRLFTESRGDKFMIHKGNVESLTATQDLGSTLFAALRQLRSGYNVFLAPDGPFGRETGTMRILDVDCPVADGAAFLAFEAGCRTCWLSFRFHNRTLSPVVEAGPVRDGNESFDVFRFRLYRFYADRIEDALTADPCSLALSPRWSHRIRSMLAARGASRNDSAK